MGRRGNNEGSVIRRKDGRWQGAVTIGYGPDGRRQRRYFYGRTRAEVVAAMEQVLTELRAGTYVAPTDITVGQWLDTWLRDYATPSIRPTTRASYEYIIRVHLRPALGQIRLRQLQAAQVQRLLNERLASGLSPRTVQIIHTVLHAALRQAAMEGIVSRNVCDYVRKPKVKRREMRVLSPDEMARLLDAAGHDRLGVAVVVMLGTGLRIGEMLALRWQDVDLEQGVIRVTRSASRVRTPDGGTTVVVQEPKTASGRRSIPLPPPVLSALQHWRVQQAEERLLMGSAWQDTGLVFTTPLGTMLDQRNFARLLDKLAAEAGIARLNVHALRHTYATRLLEAGVPAKTAQELLGHSTVTLTLDIYSHVLPETKRAAANALAGVFANTAANGCQMDVKRAKRKPSR